MLRDGVGGGEGKGKKCDREIKSDLSYSTGNPQVIHTKTILIHRRPPVYPQNKVFFRVIPKDLHTLCAKKKSPVPVPILADRAGKNKAPIPPYQGERSHFMRVCYER